MKTALRWLAGLLAAMVVVAGGAWLALRPPAPLGLPEPGVTLSGVTVVNPGVDRKPGQRVVVEGETIRSIEDETAPDPASPYAGAYVLPGLIDMHVHFPPPSPFGSTELFAFLFLHHGVTTVRDAGDVQGTATKAARSGIEDGRFPGPRIFACGPFVDGPDPLWPNSRVVTDPAEAERVVAEIAREYDCVKAYNGLTPNVSRALHEAARRRGIPVIGHVPQGSRFDDAELDDVQHTMGIAFAEGEEGPYPKSLKAWRQVDDARMEEVVRVALARGVALTPTLVALERLSRTDDRGALSAEPDVQLLPRVYRDVVWASSGRLTAEDYAAMRDALEAEKRLVRRLHEAGARLHVGTDSLVAFVVPGASMHRELALLVNAGLTPEEAWAIATRENGEFLGVAGLGRLAAGAPADLLVFRQDPTRDLKALSTLEAVVARGRLYERSALDAQLERYQSYARGFLFDRASIAITRRVLARLRQEPPDPWSRSGQRERDH
jgi:imidazolonepropionase-like amidohydrolase